jgi:hypothetical protein
MLVETHTPPKISATYATHTHIHLSPSLSRFLALSLARICTNIEYIGATFGEAININIIATFAGPFYINININVISTFALDPSESNNQDQIL